MPHDHPQPPALAPSLELTSCAACGEVAEVGASFAMPGLAEPERYVRTRCVLGHVFVGPEFALRRS